MPFDSVARNSDNITTLRNRLNAIPQLYTYHPMPPRPVIPWAEIMVPAVNQIAQAAMYQSPYERARRNFEMAKISNETQLMPLQVATQQKQLELEQRYLNNMNAPGTGGMTGAGIGNTGAAQDNVPAMGSPYFQFGKGFGAVTPEQWWSMKKNQAMINSLTTKTTEQNLALNNALSLGNRADEIRKQNQQLADSTPAQSSLQMYPSTEMGFGDTIDWEKPAE